MKNSWRKVLQLERRLDSILEEKDLLEIFHRKYDRGSVISATSRPIEDWGKILGDHAATSAILDRFLDSVHIIKITGKSYRLKTTKNNDVDKEQEN